MITEYKNAQSDTLLNDMAQGATTGTLTSGNFGTPAADVYLVFDYDVAAKYEVKKCTVAGAALTGVSHISGANVAHTAGCKVGRMWVAENAEDFADGTAMADNAIINRHLADNAVETLQIKDANVTAAKLATDAVETDKIKDAQITNAKLSTTAGEPGGAWKGWTPTWANFTKGAATIVAKYTQIGKTVHFRISVTLAADSSMGTSPTFTLPVTSVTYDTGQHIGLVHIRDLAPANFEGLATWISTTTATINTLNAASTYLSVGGCSATVPMTWATGDYFNITGTYEAA